MSLSSAPWLEVLSPEPPEGTVTALVAGALRRDRASERQLYERFAPPVRRFARGVLRDPHDASDVVQETFARAFRLLPTLERPAELAPWLHGIARNVCLECLKSRKRARSALPWAALLVAAGQATSPEHELIGRQAAEQVSRALSAMPAARRQALGLRVEHGLGYQQIAELLGWSLSKAKVEVHRARRVIDAALHGTDDATRGRSRWLPWASALALTLVLASVLVGAGPGEPAPVAPEGATLLASDGGFSHAPDASSPGVPMSVPVAQECESPSSRPTAPAVTKEPSLDLPWSDAPVTKAIQAP